MVELKQLQQQDQLPFRSTSHLTRYSLWTRAGPKEMLATPVTLGKKMGGHENW